MSIQEDNIHLGQAAEALIMLYITENYGHYCIPSIDPFDNKKDFVSHIFTGPNKTRRFFEHEVKGGAPYYKYGAFAVDWNQENKTNSIEHLWFVEPPQRINPLDDEHAVFDGKVHIWHSHSSHRMYTKKKILGKNEEQYRLLFPFIHLNLVSIIDNSKISAIFTRHSHVNWSKNDYYEPRREIAKAVNIEKMEPQ